MVDIFIVTFIIIETCIVYNISSQSDKYPPNWPSTKRFVDIFNWNNIFHALICRSDRVMPESNVKANKPLHKKTIRAFSPRDDTDTPSIFKFAGGGGAMNKKDYNNDNRSRYITNNIDTSLSYEVEIEDHDTLTWKDVAQAIDVLSQIIFSIGYIIASIILFVYAVSQPNSFLYY